MRVLMVFVVFCFASIAATAQKLVKNEVDEFTGAHIKETDWNTLVDLFSNQGRYLYKIRKVDEKYLFDFKILLKNAPVSSVNEGDKFLLKLEDGTIVSLENTNYAISCVGCGSNGVSGSQQSGLSLTYSATLPAVQSLYDHPIVAIRLYANGTEHDANVSSKNDHRLKKAIQLIASK